MLPAGAEAAGPSPCHITVTASLTPPCRVCDTRSTGGYHHGAMNLGEPIFIFILAFILLGPKRTSELARQVGKLMNEFRKASNDFKYQFNEEMRVSEQQEQQRKQEAERAALTAGTAAAGGNTILPPESAAGNVAGNLSGSVSDSPAPVVPYAISAVSATTGEEHPLEDHPLLRVDVIPPMDGSPADGVGHRVGIAEPATGGTPALAQAEDEASLHHG